MRRTLFPLLALLPSCTSSAALQSSDVLYQTHRFTVTTLDPAQDTLKLYWRHPQSGQAFLGFGELRQYLAQRGEVLLFATNSGIYTPQYASLGLHIEGGKVLVPLNRARSGGNFALRPNGVFWLSGQKAGVTETQAYARLGIRPTYATQSGPLLVQGGKVHPEFNKSSTSFKLRSGVGVCEGGKVKFAISSGAVNFYTFATFFRDALHCPDALYLDGSISALYTPQRGDNQWVNFAGIWGVSVKK